jgi:hypothetical protein
MHETNPITRYFRKPSRKEAISAMCALRQFKRKDGEA